MKRFYLAIILFVTQLIVAQENDTVKVVIPDTMTIFNYQLNEIVVTRNGVYVSDEERQMLAILKRRVYKVYPYARVAATHLVMLNENMAKLKTDKERKKYFKIVEKYLEDEFEPRLKKLSRKDGQILVKLIHRQAGLSTFSLIKNYKSGWKAFWANTTARMYDINLKAEYKPFEVAEDFYIEGMLVSAFRQGHLIKQDPANAIDLKLLAESWRAKIKAKKQQSQTNP